jgi:hypothetical protein
MNNNNNKLLWVVIGLTILMVAVGLGSKMIVDKVADRVIQKLQKEYSPSPYGPGIDPDKLDSEKLRQKGATPPMRVTDPAAGADWQSGWEAQRK